MLKNLFLILKLQALRMKVILPFFSILQIMVGVGMIIGLGYFIPDIDKNLALFIVSGGPAITIMTVGMTLVPQIIAEDKDKGVFDFFWSLPIHKSTLLIADIIIWTSATLPGVILSIVVGSVYYNFTVIPNITLIPSYFLVAITSTLVGYAIAYASPNMKITNLIANFLIFSLFLFSPIIYPINRLPQFLQFLHKVLPIKYMADLLRGGLTNTQLNMELAFLIVTGWFFICSIILFILMSKKS